MLFTSLSFAKDIASCSNPIGKSYYPELGLITKKDAGWSDDKITGGITKLSKLANGKYDILFVDATKQIISSTEDGGSVLMLSKGDNVVSFIVIYPGKTAEIYTFLKNKSGVMEYIQITSRSGNGVLITKSTLMRGVCSYIKFDEL